MTRKSLLAILSLLLSGHARAFDDKTVAAKNGLISAIQAEDQSRVKPGAPPSGKSGTAYIRNLDLAFRQESKQQVEYSLGQIAENYRSPEVARAIDGLQTALIERAEKRENAEIAGLEALAGEVATVLKSSSKPEDLDALLEKINKLGESSSERRSEKVSAAYQAIRPTKQFVSNWQDYLEALRKDNRNKANQILQSLATSSGSIPVPRSRLIALITETTEPVNTPRGVPAEIKELDEIGPVLRKMRAVPMSGHIPGSAPLSMESESLARSLAVIDQAYQNFKAGLPVSLDFITGTAETNGIAGDATSARLKAKLLLLILPRLAGAPEKTAAKSGEDAIALADRMIREAGERGDIGGCVRAIEVSQRLKRGTTTMAAVPSPLGFFRAGQSQEAAGQKAAAVISYQNSLAAGCDLTLAGLIGKRLEAIKRENPDDYKQAMESLLNPPK